MASIEYLDKQTPVKKKASKQKKRSQKRIKKQQNQHQKQQQNKNKKGIPTTFFIIAAGLFIGLVAWALYFFPLLASGSLTASTGCLAPFIALVLGFLGIFFSIILLVGVLIFTLFAIIIIHRNKQKKEHTAANHTQQIEADDFIKIQIQDKASKDLPYLAPETLEKYVNIKDSIVELKYERSKLNATKARGPIKDSIQRKIQHIERSITAKEALLDTIEKIHADLEPIPEHKRLAYTNIIMKLAKLKSKQKIYLQETDLRAIGRLRAVEEAIKEQEDELKRLLGMHKD
ncbi:MAG: Unknown protein [uncultured Aureispira sp.]|uniref:Uncharacterized protein n=1 Tax=uncultured Aureispira sp. TaxID=1331704 RepID=A0A6S6U141_9BACT|nr:MAG: Unknown protein [uncultured Aureispira sp.]